MNMNRKKAFTLIELLIVVAIIAILAAIAVPNFLEAQTRSKIARVNSDHRNLATALESYRVDNNDYIPHDDSQAEWNRLTTPIAYITSAPTCPFAIIRARMDNIFSYDAWNYHMEDVRVMYDLGWWPMQRPMIEDLHAHGKIWMIWSIGPDLICNIYTVGLYDSTNGTRSLGDIMRAGP